MEQMCRSESIFNKDKKNKLCKRGKCHYVLRPPSVNTINKVVSEECPRRDQDEQQRSFGSICLIPADVLDLF